MTNNLKKIVPAFSLKFSSVLSSATKFSPREFRPCRLYCSSSVPASAKPELSTAPPRPFSAVPGMKRYPFVGSLFSLLRRKDLKQMHVMWPNIAKEYGPICVLEVPLKPLIVMIANPDDIEKMYRITMDNPIRDAFHSLKKVRYEAVDNYFEKKGGLLVENGIDWWRVRSKVQVPMMKPNNLIRHLPQMDQITLEFMDRISLFQKENGEMPSNFQEELYKWALESVGMVALDQRLGCFDANISADSDQMKILNAADIIFESLNTTEMETPWWRLFPTPSYRNLKHGHQLLLSVVDKHIQQALAKIKENSSSSRSEEKEGSGSEMTLLETLLCAQGLSTKDVVTMILDMFFAGIDTTSHTLGFILYLLSRNKSAQRRVQAEVDSVLGDGKEPLTASHIARLSFLKACVKESHRIFPIVIGNARLLEEDTVLSGYHIPKKTQVFAANIVTSKDESLFPRASEFLPERWGRDKPLGPIHPFAFLPFSYGPRMCIGRRIAEQEVYTFLARAMHRFNVDYKYGDMDMITRLISGPSKPLRFEFTERK